MKRYYADIMDRIDEPPKWFDEYAVPRFCDFSPDAVADIYACQACLLRIQCQACGRPFDVALSWYRHSDIPSLEELILHDRCRVNNYGDPPNIGCCPAGPTMSSDSIRVLEFWQRDKSEWVRVPSLEVSLEDEA